jgi:hypothetical protein
VPCNRHGYDSRESLYACHELRQSQRLFGDRTHFSASRRGDQLSTAGRAQQVATTDRYPTANFAAVEQDDVIIAVAVMTPPHNLILTGDPAAVLALASMMDTHAWPVPRVIAARPLVDRFTEYWAA